MSWILKRTKGHCSQQYMDADIYGNNGKWLCHEMSQWWNLPHQYLYHDEAERHKKEESEKDPSWEYKVEQYLK